MRKVIYSMMVSLDGYIEGPNKEIDWHIIDRELHTFINNQQTDIGAYIYGRGLYENMTAFWPTADQDPDAPDYVLEWARIWKAMPKIVFSTTLKEVAWNSRLVRGDVAGEVARLKAEPGENLALGGAKLAATFMKLELIDEYQLLVQPVVLGNGTSLFGRMEKPLLLRLLETRAFASGVVYLRYQAITQS